MKKLFVFAFLLIFSVGVIVGCDSAKKTGVEADRADLLGIWLEVTPDVGNFEFEEGGAFRIFDSLQTQEMKGQWDIPHEGRLDLTADGNVAVNFGYSFQDDQLSIWPEYKEDQSVQLKKATQDEINEMQKKASEYAKTIQEKNKEESETRNEETKIDKGNLSMKQEEAKKERRIVVLETTAGNMELAIYPKVAPKTASVFLDLVETGFYNGIIFHRVIPQFMIQFGGTTADGSPKPEVPTFKDEINPEILGLTNNLIDENTRQGYQYDYTLPSLPMKYGMVAMANAGPNTNSSQLFIVTKYEGCNWLDGKHTVFGECIDGMDIALQIQNVPTDSQFNKPLEDVVITKAYIKE
ncbi:MAG: peptidylprolyl isomerase [Caldisericia bacterium]|nr:peptidylprolyl isomerase [Caldisericia bacterium]MDD4614983.1 peptidylprolyl isomerase [Caldisericia bacterium]